jgi:hypothetical protein
MHEETCPICPGEPVAEYMGSLGFRDWFRCPCCGQDFSVPSVNDDEEVVDDELEDEPDGQPDEMQEWHDFDPDC